MRLGHDAVPEDRDRGADRLLALELDGESIHRDDAGDAPRLAADANLGAGQVAPEAVRVADRHDPDPRRPLGGEGSAVARALARLPLLPLPEGAPPGERRPQPLRHPVPPEPREPREGGPPAGGAR